MNYRLVFRLGGNALLVEAAFMLAPLLVALFYGDGDYMAFLWSVGILVAVGGLLVFIPQKSKRLRTRDAFFVAGLVWIAFSLSGALPLLFSGYFNSFIDCVFEASSGFTTTGATILTNVEILPHGVLFWRSLMHWIGGVGVLVFMMAVIPNVNASSINLLRAESTGPAPDKIVPRIRETARIMCLIYIAMTALLTILLCIVGMTPFDALTNAFSTAGTGGFSNLNASFGGYGNPAAEIIITVFMFLFGISFSLYFILLRRKAKKFLMDNELRLYLGLVLAAILIIAVNISGLYGGFVESLRYSSFQVTSIVTTTGFATADFALWPALSQAILVLLMLTGCCAGSTGGGIKLIRVLLLFKAARIRIHRIFHPESVKAVQLNGKTVTDEMVSNTALFVFVYFAVFALSTVLVSIEGKDLMSNATAVVTTLSNVGPGLGIVGPTGNFASYTPFSKSVLSFCMIAGRLEFFPILILFAPSAWKRGMIK